MIDITLEELFEAGAHFGHQSKRWNPKMQPYLFGVREGIHVFDLAKTRELLLEALEVLSKASADGKTIMFVGTKKQAKDKLAQVAQSCGSLYVDQRWLGGTLTNFGQIQKSLKSLEEMKNKLAAGEYSEYTKKERVLIERKIADLEKSFGGIATMHGLPDLMVVIDTHHEKGAVAEANKTEVPIIGVIDSNSDPTLIDYPIPMNDDASNSLNLVLDLFERAIMEGKKGTSKAKKKSK